MSKAGPLDPEARLRAEVDRAVAPYVGIAPPAMLAKMRALAERYYREHPEAARVLHVLDHPRPMRSGTVALAADDGESQTAAVKKG
ncbi:MAG: hypothetical protein QM820_39355 [Minicystis sp.]